MRAREGFATRTALGWLLLNLLASLAEFEVEVLSERVRAGMDRVRGQGVHIGRPPVAARPGFAERWRGVRADTGEVPPRAVCMGRWGE